MNLAIFKIFRDLVDNRSFSKAAALNSVTQSAVSQQVAGLEKRLKCRLLERSGKELHLTPEGQRFYEGAGQLVDTYDQLMNDLQRAIHQVSGPLRIATVYSIGLHELPPLIKKFIKQFPRVEMHVQYRRASQVYEDVQRQQADLGFVAFPEKATGLELRPFRRDRLVLICHPRHPFAARHAMPIASIRNHPFVGFDADLPTRRALERVFRKHRLHIEPVMDFDNIETLKRAVEVEMGISIVPLSTVAEEIANRTLKAVEFVDEELFRPLAVILCHKPPPSPAAEAFLKMLENDGKG